MRAGTGQEFEGKCGEVAKIVSCFSNNAHKKGRKPIFNNCHRYICPVCYEDTCGRSADEIDERLNELAKLWRERGRDLREPHHWNFSPDDQAKWSREAVEADGGKGIWREFAKRLKQAVPFYTVDRRGQRVNMDEYNALNAAQKRVIKAARGPFKKIAFDYGVVAIFHGEREKFFYNGIWMSKADLPRNQENGALAVDSSKLPHDWVWAPHFHVLGFAFFKNSESFHQASGWTYKKIRNTAEQRDIRSTAKYQLTHCTVIIHDHTDYHGQQRERQFGLAYRYYGLVSNAKGSFVEEVTEEEALCEECQKEGIESYLHQFGVIKVDEHYEPDRQLDYGVHIIKKRTRHWYINDHVKPKRKVQCELYDQMKRRREHDRI